MPGQDFGQRHAFIFGLVGQHRAHDRITDGIEARDVGREMGVGLDLAARQHFDPQRLQPKARSIGLAARGHQDDVGVEGGLGCHPCAVYR